jgi:hypothetical protein
MNISGVGNASGSLDIYRLSALQSTGGIAALSAGSGTRQAAGASGPVPGGSDSVEISQPGQMLSQLQQLKSKDPAQFKQVLSDTANQLRALAQQAGPSAGGSALAELADRFQTAANTGDLSVLQPKGHHHHHPASWSGTAGQTSAPDQTAVMAGLTSPGAASSTGSNVKSQLSSIFATLQKALSQ